MTNTKTIFNSPVDINDDLNVVDLNVSGTKNFRIAYPGKPDKCIKHSCWEGNSPGTCYKFREVECVKGENDLELPPYFALLNKNAMVFSNPCGHFGLSYGSVTGNTVTVVTSKAGKYNILVCADRNDACCQNYQDVVDAPVEEEENGSDHE